MVCRLDFFLTGEFCSSQSPIHLLLSSWFITTVVISIPLKTFISLLPSCLLISAAVCHLRRDCRCSLTKYFVLACNKTANILLHYWVHGLFKVVLYFPNITVQKGSRQYVIYYLQIWREKNLPSFVFHGILGCKSIILV
jgi:hypothetical protein